MTDAFTSVLLVTILFCKFVHDSIFVNDETKLLQRTS